MVESFAKHFQVLFEANLNSDPNFAYFFLSTPNSCKIVRFFDLKCFLSCFSFSRINLVFFHLFQWYPFECSQNEFSDFQGYRNRPFNVSSHSIFCLATAYTIDKLYYILKYNITIIVLHVILIYSSCINGAFFKFSTYQQTWHSFCKCITCFWSFVYNIHAGNSWRLHKSYMRSVVLVLECQITYLAPITCTVPMTYLVTYGNIFVIPSFLHSWYFVKWSK